MAVAMKRNAIVVCVSSGGKVLDMARENNFDYIEIPGGMPPRACLGYSLTQLFYVLHALGFIKDDFKKHLHDAIALLEKEETELKAEAMEVADFLFGKLPIIYAVDGYNGVATRFRQQLNENSKMLCWHNILPEMNHNELVGWAEKHDDCAVIILRNETDYSRTQTRIEISKEVFSKYTSNVKEIWSKGFSQIERSIYLIHLTDWVSCFLADKRNVDATEINVINHLKGELSKI
jgi:glucose/mannose-6-phosphate isomerase